MLATAQGISDDLIAARERRLVESRLATVVGDCALDTRRRQFQQPADILGRHEVPRWPHDVRAQDDSLVEGAVYLCARRARSTQPHAQRPRRGLVLLRLDGSQSADHLRRGREWVAREPLLRQSPWAEMA